MENDSWQRNHGEAFMEESSWKSDPVGRVTKEEKGCRKTQARGIKKDES